MAEAVERTDEEKAQAFAAMTGSISVIDNVLDDDNEFCNDMTKAEKKEPVLIRGKDGRLRKVISIESFKQKFSHKITSHLSITKKSKIYTTYEETVDQWVIKQGNGILIDYDLVKINDHKSHSFIQFRV